jgi:L-threonylcarbamoyladenylate synthase
VGANAADPAAVRRIFEAKGRPADHPLIVHLPRLEDLDEWAIDVPDSAREVAEAFWPGPLTLVLRRGTEVPMEVTGGQETVALRVPGHPVAQRLLSEFGGGVAAPSANRFGRISPTLPQHAADELGKGVALVLDGGPSEVGVESTILDLSGAVPRLLRPGAVTREQLAQVLRRAPAVNAGDEVPRVPGALASHYAPVNPVELFLPPQLEERLEGNERRNDSGQVSVLARRPAPASFGGRWLQLPADPSGYAHRLYAALRELDSYGAPILVEAPPQDEAWEAVNDRLMRATGGLRVPAAREGSE